MLPAKTRRTSPHLGVKLDSLPATHEHVCFAAIRDDLQDAGMDPSRAFGPASNHTDSTNKATPTWQASTLYSVGYRYLWRFGSAHFAMTPVTAAALATKPSMPSFELSDLNLWLHWHLGKSHKFWSLAIACVHLRLSPFHDAL